MPPSRKEISHDRILETAARALRQNGFEGVGVADVMKQAGLTHGGFYAHFPNRNAMLAEAVVRAGQESSLAIGLAIDKRCNAGVSAFTALVESYLSDSHMSASDTGCPVASLSSEMPRQPLAVQVASAQRVQALVNRVAQALPHAEGKVTDRAQAFVVTSTLVGALQLARAMGDAKQGRALLASTRHLLLAQYEPLQH